MNVYSELGAVGPWTLAVEGRWPRELVVYFQGAVRVAAELLERAELGRLSELVGGPVCLGPRDEARPSACGYHLPQTGRVTVVGRTDKPPSARFGELPDRSRMVWTVIHETAHRAWHRLSAHAQAEWVAFVGHHRFRVRELERDGRAPDEVWPEAVAGVVLEYYAGRARHGGAYAGPEVRAALERVLGGAGGVAEARALLSRIRWSSP